MVGFEGAFGKALDFAERKAWVAAVVIAFVLFIPNGPAEQIGIKSIREQWQGYIWIAFVLACLLTLGAVISYFDKRLGGWLSARAEERRRQAEQAALEAKLKLRLGSLNNDERYLVLMCLDRGSQSYSARLGHTASESLNNKGLLRRGSGTVFDVAYHFTDEAWQYLQQHRDEFLTDAERKDPRFKRVIEATERALHDEF